MPEALEALIANCSSKSPDDRPPSAADLAHALRDLAKDPALASSEEQAREWWSAKRSAQLE